MKGVRRGAISCPQCGGGAMPDTVEKYGCCSRCAQKSRIYEFDRISAALREPSWYQVEHTKQSKDRIVREFLDSLQDMRSTELAFDDTPAGRAWHKLAGVRRCNRQR